MSPAPALAKTPHEFHTAKVISQEIGSSNRGAAVMPMGTMMVGIPLERRSDVVILETPKARITLSELMTGRGPVVLPVNGTVQFYQDGRWLVILDSNNKKHRFGLLHIEILEAPK